MSMTLRCTSMFVLHVTNEAALNADIISTNPKADDKI